MNDGIKVKLEVDDSLFGGKIEKAKAQTRSFGEAGKTAFATYAKAGIYVAAAIGAATIAYTKFIKPASDAEEALSKFNTIFKTQAPAVSKWADNLALSMGRSSTSLKSAAADFQAFLLPLTGSDKVASQMSMALTELSEDIASFHNIDVEEALTKLKSGMVGETEAVKSLGVVMTENVLKQEMMRLGYQGQFASLDELAKAQVRFNVIMTATKEAQGDAIRTQDGLANSQRALSAAWDDFSKGLGELFLPIIKDVVVWLKEVLVSWNKIRTAATIEKKFKDASETLDSNREAMRLWAEEAGMSVEQYSLKAYGMIARTEELIAQNKAAGKSTYDFMDAMRDLNGEFSVEDLNMAENIKKLKASQDAYVGAEKALRQYEAGKTAGGTRDEALLDTNKIINGRMGKEGVSAGSGTGAGGKDSIDELAWQQLVLEGYVSAKDQELMKDQQIADARVKLLEKVYFARIGFESQGFKGAQMFAQAGQELMNSSNKKLFMVGQAAALANIIMNTAQAITKGYAQLGPIGGTAFAALMGTTASIQTQRVLAQKPPPKLDVGVFNVPRDMPAIIHQGETVLPKTFAQSLRDGELSFNGGERVINLMVDGVKMASVVDAIRDINATNSGTRNYYRRSVYE